MVFLHEMASGRSSLTEMWMTLNGKHGAALAIVVLCAYGCGNSSGGLDNAAQLSSIESAEQTCGVYKEQLIQRGWGGDRDNVCMKKNYEEDCNDVLKKYSILDKEKFLCIDDLLKIYCGTSKMPEKSISEEERKKLILPIKEVNESIFSLSKKKKFENVFYERCAMYSSEKNFKSFVQKIQDYLNVIAVKAENKLGIESRPYEPEQQTQIENSFDFSFLHTFNAKLYDVVVRHDLFFFFHVLSLTEEG